MAVPKYYEMYHSFLQSLSDGEEHPYSDVKKKVIEDFKLTDIELAELLPSGKQPVFSNRIGWCRTYLKKAGLIESPTKAHFMITKSGREVLKSGKKITNEVLREFPSFVKFIDGDTEKVKDTAEEKDSLNNDETPQETLERVYGELNNVLKDELLTRIHEKSPDFFEKMVVELMEKMGYGRGQITQKSRDEGIDGMVYQDKLGFDVIYIQAKRYDLEKRVGRPELQKFGGAIPEKNAKGLFVTTGRFSPDAQKYANDRHIILIDGQHLAELMIEHDFGVSTEYTYRIKRIDMDVFEEED